MNSLILCSVHAISSINRGRERITSREKHNFFPPSPQWPYIVIQQQRFSSAAVLFPRLYSLSVYCQFPFNLTKWVKLTPWKHPELSGSPENWSSNFGRYIIPTDSPEESASRQLRGLARLWTSSRKNPGLNIQSLSFHSSALSSCKHPHVFTLRTKSADPHLISSYHRNRHGDNIWQQTLFALHPSLSHRVVESWFRALRSSFKP